MASGDEEFEVLDLSIIQNTSWVPGLVGDVTKRSAAQQLVIGGVSGWVSGYLFVKVGKLAAFSLGSSILLLQIAKHQGYIKIDWTRLEKDVEKAKRQIERKARRQYPGMIENVKDFFKKNVFLAGSFGGGFLIGLVF